MNLNLKIIALFDELDRRIRELASEVAKKQQKGDKGDKGDRGEKGDTGAKGKDGRDGLNGINGVDGRNGINGQDGKDGADGADGQDGISVIDANIEADNHLYLTLSDGSEIDAGEIAGGDIGNIAISSGGGGGGTATPTVKYTAVTTTPYYIASADLITGRNFYGVDAGQDAFIYLPTDIPAEKIVTINNESDTYTLTIDTYVE